MPFSVQPNLRTVQSRRGKGISIAQDLLSLSLKDLHRAGISIAFAIHSFDLFTHLIVRLIPAYEFGG